MEEGVVARREFQRQREKRRQVIQSREDGEIELALEPLCIN